MRKCLFFLAIVALGNVSIARAQIVQNVNRFATSGSSEMTVAKAVDDGHEAKGAQIVSQANVDMSTDATKVGIQAVDLWLTRYVRMYGRLTLPVKQTEDSSKAASSTTAATNSVAVSTASTKVSAAARQQLIDPYGGLFNLSGGLFYSIANPFVTSKALQDVRGYRADTKAREMFSLLTRLEELGESVGVDKYNEVNQLQDPHGLFLDARAGFKFIELPAPGDSSPTVAGSKVAVFYTGIAGVKLIAPLYDTEPTGNAAVDKAHETGGLTLGAYVVYNYAADTTQSSAFTDQLNRQTTALTGVVGWNLPNSSIAALTFSFTPWTSDARFGKTFVFGVTLQSKSNGSGNGT